MRSQTLKIFARKPALAMFVLLLCNTVALAQGGVIDEATAFLTEPVPNGIEDTCFSDDAQLKDQRAWVIHVVFSEQLTEKDVDLVRRPEQYVLFDVVNQKAVPIRGICVDVDNSIVMLNISPEQIVDKGLYHLHVLKLSFGGEATKKPMNVPLSFGTGPGGSPPNKPVLTVVKANGRNDANIYISGELQRASGTDFTGAVDIKLSYPFYRDIGPTNRRTTHIFAPFFDIKGSSDPKADNDSLNLGLQWDWVLRMRPNPIFAGAQLRNTWKVESDRDFRDTNLLYEPRLILPLNMPREFKGGSVIMSIEPFIGFELGKNLKSLLEEAEGGAIVRPLFGADYILFFPIGSPGLDEIRLEASYIRRMPLKREVTFDFDDDANPVLVSFGRGPRDHVDAKLNFNFTEAFGAFIGYEYGELPPLYNLVDHSMKIGFTYKMKFKRVRP